MRGRVEPEIRMSDVGDLRSVVRRQTTDDGGQKTAFGIADLGFLILDWVIRELENS
jgi:hypothetical protein